MALTVTVAGASSDSYATLVEANAAVGWKNSAWWGAAADADKEAVLVAAAQIMDSFMYKGSKSATTQALRFPSVGMTSSGSLYIPDRIKRAQAYLALALGEDPDLMTGPAGISSVAATGSFNVTFSGGEGGGGSGDPDLPPDVKRELNPWLWTHGPSTGGEWDSATRSWT